MRIRVTGFSSRSVIGARTASVRASIARRAALALLAAVSAAPAPAQPFVEWMSPPGEVMCESVAVPPELDERLRRHEIEGVTALRVTVGLDGTFSAPVVIERSGSTRESIALDRLAWSNVVRCRLAGREAAELGVTRRVEYQWNFRAPQPLRVK